MDYEKGFYEVVKLEQQEALSGPVYLHMLYVPLKLINVCLIPLYYFLHWRSSKYDKRVKFNLPPLKHMDFIFTIEFLNTIDIWTVIDANAFIEKVYLVVIYVIFLGFPLWRPAFYSKR